MPRKNTIPSKTVFEEIQSLSEFPDQKLVRVVFGLTDEDGNFIVPQQFNIVEIKDEMYDDLLSANPSWSPNKPQGTYFNDDLWHFIDMIRSS